MRHLMSIIRPLDALAKSKTRPVAHAFGPRIDLSRRVRRDGINLEMFNAEAWMITTGNDVYITSGWRFVTPDDGNFVLPHPDQKRILTAPIGVRRRFYSGLGSLVTVGLKSGVEVILGVRSVVARWISANYAPVGSLVRLSNSLDQYCDEISWRSLRREYSAKKGRPEVTQSHFGVKT